MLSHQRHRLPALAWHRKAPGQQLGRFLVAGALMICAAFVFAQTAETPILTVEQAQQRAQYAREQMTAAERGGRAAEKKEQAAYKDLESAQKRMEDAQRAYEEAKVRAEQATQA